MSEKASRFIYGSLYMAIMWFCTWYSVTSFKLLFFLIAIVSIYEMRKIRKGKTKILAFAYIIIPFFIIQLMSNQTTLILLAFILTWTFDTFAYLFGIKFGKRKIMPSVSPKKSWEGFTGGFISTILAAYIASQYFFSINLTSILSIAFLLPFTATLGDFIESYYKRQAEIKDSGKLIPGHGGILDRMDSFMITIPVLYLYSKIIL